MKLFSYGLNHDYRLQFFLHNVALYCMIAMLEQYLNKCHCHTQQFTVHYTLHKKIVVALSISIIS